MGILSRLLGRAEPQALVTTSQDLATVLLAGLRDVAAGINVNHTEAMKCPAVAVSVKVIAESVAQLPFSVIRLGDEGAQNVSASNPVHKLLSSRGKPNAWQTPYEFKLLMTRHVALRGNAYALKQTVGGVLDALIPLHPTAVEVAQQDSGALEYTLTLKNGRQVKYAQDDIFYLRGASDDGITGLDPIRENAEAIGLALAQDRYASKLFANGAKPSGVLQNPKALSEIAYKRLKESFEQQYSGVENAHKAIILEDGATWASTSMTPEDSQMLDSRKLQRSIVCSLWRIPPHMIGDLDKATFSNIENLARQMVDYALMPWLDLWQQAIQTQLFTQSQRASQVAKFNVNALLRGDAKTRAEFYQSAVTNGWMSPNEVREKEDMPPREGGDDFLTPLNMSACDEPQQKENGDDAAKN